MDFLLPYLRICRIFVEVVATSCAIGLCSKTKCVDDKMEQLQQEVYEETMGHTTNTDLFLFMTTFVIRTWKSLNLEPGELETQHSKLYSCMSKMPVLVQQDPFFGGDKWCVIM